MNITKEEYENILEQARVFVRNSGTILDGKVPRAPDNLAQQVWRTYAESLGLEVDGW